MKKIIDFLRKIGVSQISKGDYYTGEFDTREDLKRKDSKTSKNSTQKTQSEAGKRVLFWGAFIFMMLMLLGSFGTGGTFGILAVWIIALFILKQFAFDGKFTWWLAIIVFLLAIVFSFIIMPSDNSSSTDNNSSKNVKDLKKYDGKNYQVTSDSKNIQGSVGITIREGSYPVVAYYNIHISDTFPVNKKCETGPYRTDANCRWIDFYNYAGGLFSESDPEAAATTQLYPVFCDSFVQISDTNTGLTGEYIKCWYGKGNKQKETAKFYWGTMRAFQSIDEFLSYNMLNIYDSKPYTTREFILENNKGTSTESMDTETAVKNGEKMKSYNIILESE